MTRIYMMGRMALVLLGSSLVAPAMAAEDNWWTTDLLVRPYLGASYSTFTPKEDFIKDYVGDEHSNATFGVEIGNRINETFEVGVGAHVSPGISSIKKTTAIFPGFDLGTEMTSNAVGGYLYGRAYYGGLFGQLHGGADVIWGDAKITIPLGSISQSYSAVAGRVGGGVGYQFENGWEVMGTVDYRKYDADLLGLVDTGGEDVTVGARLGYTFN